MSSKKYLISTMGRKSYMNLPKNIRDTFDRLDSLPPTKKPVTVKQILDALK